MKGVSNDNSYDDAPAASLPHCGDTHPDFSKAPELYCRDLFDCRRPCRLVSLTPLLDCSSEFAGRGKDEEERRCSLKLPAIHQPLLSLIAGILILIVPGLLNLIVAVYLIVVGLLGLMRRQNRLFSV